MCLVGVELAWLLGSITIGNDSKSLDSIEHLVFQICGNLASSLIDLYSQQKLELLGVWVIIECGCDCGL